MEIFKIIEILFLLLCGHALADFGLQTSFVGRYKYRKYANELPKEQKLNEVWPWVLIGHGLIHGFFVYLFTRSLVFGFIETFAHCLIDFLKCEGKLNVHEDQLLHILCKIIYVISMVTLW